MNAFDAAIDAAAADGAVAGGNGAVDGAVGRGNGAVDGAVDGGNGVVDICTVAMETDG